MKKICSECKSEISKDANVCPECSIRIEGVECAKCKSMCKVGAKICKWCLNSLEINKNKFVNFESFAVKSELVPTLLFSGTFLSQYATFNQEKIVIVTPYSFGLSSRTEEVLWNKVTGFQYHEGIFWDSVTIETKGQTTNQINFLSKINAKKIVDLLRKLQT